ncbi:MAG TPA: hypothetical protein GX515_03710 [Firmicutes bacterium]|nr:hypothetical protein [Bacillota bacterium]
MIGFHHEKIEVARSGESLDPVALKWRDKEYKITQIKKVWQDAAFAGPASGRGRSRSWWDQHGRTFYRVAVDSGQTLDIYFDPRKEEWYLSKSWNLPTEET